MRNITDKSVNQSNKQKKEKKITKKKQIPLELILIEKYKHKERES